MNTKMIIVVLSVCIIALFYGLTEKKTHRSQTKEAYFERGYDWAQGKHIYCPPNPQTASSQYVWVAEAWVEGFLAGRKDGGKSLLPRRYSKLVDSSIPLESKF